MLFTIGFILFFGLAFDLVTSLLAAYEWRKAWHGIVITRNGRAMLNGKFISTKGKPAYNQLF